MIDLDSVDLDIECPNCSFFNKIKYRDARLRDVVICRGCKSNIQLDDHVNECRKARRAVAAAFADLERSLSGLNRTIQIKL